jgi:LacI family transcriptional regulator
MSYKTTITDIARQLNTTPATVSRALSDHPGISPERKQSVQLLAKKLGYKRNKIASSLRSGRTHMIGVIVPSAEINFFGSVVHGIESIANANGYNVLIYQSNESYEQEVKGIETFLTARVDGMLVSIAKNTHDFSHFTEVRKRGIPIAFFDRDNDEIGIPSVVVDDYSGAYNATSHLIQQGYKRIAHISGPEHLKIFRNRLQGYKDALAKNKMILRKEYIYQGNVTIESGKAAAAYFLSLPKPPDAVFAVEDFTALGMMKELKDRKIRIPEDFGIVGFANELFGEHVTPALSTVDQQTVDMGKEAVKMVMDMIGSGVSNKKPIRLVLDAVAVYRDSSAKKGKAVKNGKLRTP